MPSSSSASQLREDELVSSFMSLQIPKTHITVGLSNAIASNKQYRSLFINRRIPEYGWSDIQIQHLLFLFSTLDTNNKQTTSSMNNNDPSSRWCGVGEREGRVYSSLVLNRHYGFAHGIGRSGDITEPQPKAVGSSALAKLTLLLVMDIIRRVCNLDSKTTAKHGILIPMCTGMSMSLVLSALREEQKKKIKTQTTTSNSDETNKVENKDDEKTIVLWSRIDQKSCFKAITSAGLTCVVVPTKLDGDMVVTDIDAMEKALQQYKGKVLAIITTTSCFAPRVPDKVDLVAKLCKQYDVYHVINNAYGLQCHKKTSKLINRACVVGRVDAIVCSTDKNFLVPVGGAIVMSPMENIIQGIGKVYAGRASAAPIIDLFITLLSMGLNGYKSLLEKRLTMMETFPQKLASVATKHGERLLECTDVNTISYGITLDTLAPQQSHEESKEEKREDEYLKSISKEISNFGAMLFTRCVSGTRVIPRGVIKKMGDEEFHGFGSSVTNYPHAYMTAALAIGGSQSEVDEFFVRLDNTLTEFKKKQKKAQKKKEEEQQQSQK